MNLVLIGTDHRLQQSIVQDEKTKIWFPRNGGHRYRKLVEYCIKKFYVRAILEETHPDQERTAPTIASLLAKKGGLVWQTLGLGEIALTDALLDPPLVEAVRQRLKPELLAGIYDLQ